MRKNAAIALVLGAVMLTAVPCMASAISIYSAPHAYQNGGVNPCVFSGNGDNGCGTTLTLGFPDWVTSTQQFDTNPLVNTYGDQAGELAQFAQIGRQFILGLDVNQGGAVQTLTNLTITFRDANGNVLGTGYQFSPVPTNLPVTDQGEGWTDYVVAAGCLNAPGGGSGLAATCSNYQPFIAPIGTRQLTFTYGMGVFNDGAERLFLISAGPGGVPVPFDVDPTPVPEPASLALLGSGLLGVVRTMRKRKTVV
jgi:hypothetical protein